MRKNYSVWNILFAVLLALTCSTSVQAEGWEEMLPLDACYSFHIDQKTGTFLASDFRGECDGGIYYSDDKGATWTKCSLKDNNYGTFVETDKYLFALGYAGYIARSEDGGHTWELMSYRRYIQDIVSDDDMDYTAAYGMVQVGNRLYLCDYAGGVLYSEDYGETWTHTNDDIFLEESSDSKKGSETFHNVLYNIVEQNGHILAIGLYCVYEYNPATDTWKITRSDSNLMAIACHHNGKLYCGRAMPNESSQARFLEVTADGKNWYGSGRPASVDNNIRAIGSNDKLLVVGMQSTGVLCTDDDGESWYEVDLDNLPLRYPGLSYMKDQKLTPMAVQFDDDYLYMAFYDTVPTEDYDPGTEPGVYRIKLSDIQTGIRPVDLSKLTNNQLYDLSGRPSRGERGIFIKGGKKIMRTRP